MEAIKDEAIVDQVTGIISKQLRIPIEQLTPTTPLQELGAESLDFIEIIFALEETFEIDIPYNANEAAAAGTGEPAGTGAGMLENIEQISAAVKDLMDAKSSA